MVIGRTGWFAHVHCATQPVRRQCLQPIARIYDGENAWRLLPIVARPPRSAEAPARGRTQIVAAIR